MFGISNKGTKNGLEGAALDTSDARQRLLRELRLVAADVHGGEAAVRSQRLHDGGNHAARNIRRATRDVQHAAWNRQHATCNRQHATRNAQRATRNITQHKTTRQDDSQQAPAATASFSAARRADQPDATRMHAIAIGARHRRRTLPMTDPAVPSRRLLRRSSILRC